LEKVALFFSEAHSFNWMESLRREGIPMDL
jgi:hypothetical protein